MARTILIGLDGGTFSILDPLMADGTMPNLRFLVARGSRATLTSTIPPVTFPGFTSMMTGRSPGEHGIFDFVQPEEREQGLFFSLNTSYDVRCETIWSILSRNDRPLICLNFPLTYPQQPVLGSAIPGFVSLRHLRRNVHPAELYDRMRSLPGFRAADLAMDLDEERKSIQGLSAEEADGWIGMHLRRERQLFTVLEHLLRTDPWQLAAIVFDGVDKVQHAFWRLLDPSLATAPEAWEQQIASRCREYFQQVDDFIGRIAAVGGPDSRVFLASDHGFGPSTEVFYVNSWLAQHGYLAWGEDVVPDRELRLTEDRLKNHVGLIDWAHTIAYAFTPSSNGIFIRMADGPGKVGIPPRDYERVRDDIASSLLSFADHGGGPVVRRVWKREEIFAGSAMPKAPDLTLELRDGGFVSVLKGEQTLAPRQAVAGTHRPDGIFVAAGAGIREGVDIGRLSILDIAPTLLHSVELPIPGDFEGRPAEEAFTAEYRASNPVRRGMPTNRPQPFSDDGAAMRAAADDEAVIMARLRALGYVE